MYFSDGTNDFWNIIRYNWWFWANTAYHLAKIPNWYFPHFSNDLVLTDKISHVVKVLHVLCVFCNTVAACSSFSFTRRKGQALPPGDDNYNFNEVDNNADEDDEDEGDDDDDDDNSGGGDDGDKIKFFHLLLFLVFLAAAVLHDLHQFFMMTCVVIVMLMMACVVMSVVMRTMKGIIITSALALALSGDEM